MLDLKKDLYAHLVISAQKNRNLNKPFRVIHANKWETTSAIKPDTTSKFEEIIETIPEIHSKNTNTLFTPIKTKPVEKIDEKVDKIIADPILLEIKAELEFAEALLQKIKSIDKHNAKIPAIEETVSRLKMVLDQKMYV